MSIFLLTPERHAAEVRARFAGESTPQLCARIGYDIGDSPDEDLPHLFAVIEALRAADRAVALAA